jgi:hypothetical protein
MTPSQKAEITTKCRRLIYHKVNNLAKGWVAGRLSGSLLGAGLSLN